MKVIVVGAGITGVSSAEWLRRDGHDVTLVDPLRPGDAGQTSFGNAGLIARTSVMPVATPALVRKAASMVFDPGAPLFLRWSYLPRLLPWLLPFLGNARLSRLREIAESLSALTFDSTEQHMALARGTKAESYIQIGEYVTLYRAPGDYHGDALWSEMRARHNLAPEELNRAALVDRDPHLGPDYTFGTLFRDFGWIVDPGRYVAALFDHYRQQGGGFRQGQVVDIAPGEAPSVTLDGGDVLAADRIVICAGVWSGAMARRLGTGMRLEAERGYHLSMFAPSITPPGPYMVTDAKFVLTPMQGFLRAAGVVEFAGIDAAPSSAPPALIEKRLRRVYPGLEFDRCDTWMGRRPTTPDSLPALGADARAPNVIHAYGGQHVGLTIGPKLGRTVAALVSGQGVNLDLAPYAPGRFGR